MGHAVLDEGGFKGDLMGHVLDHGERDDPKDMTEFSGCNIAGEPNPAPLALDLQIGDDLPDVVHQDAFPLPAHRIRF